MESHTCQICGKPATDKLSNYLFEGTKIHHEQTFYLCGKHYNAFVKATKGVGVLGAIFQKIKKEK